MCIIRSQSQALPWPEGSGDRASEYRQVPKIQRKALLTDLFS